MGDELEQMLYGVSLDELLTRVPISHPIYVEVERLKEELENAITRAESAEREREEVRGQVAALRAEVEELKATTTPTIEAVAMWDRATVRAERAEAEVARLREALRELVEVDKAFTPALIAGLKDVKDAVKLASVEERRQLAIIKAEEVLK